MVVYRRRHVALHLTPSKITRSRVSTVSENLFNHRRHASHSEQREKSDLTYLASVPVEEGQNREPLGPSEMNFGEAFHIFIDHKLIIIEEYYVGIRPLNFIPSSNNRTLSLSFSDTSGLIPMVSKL